jgi:hypothetical protein
MAAERAEGMTMGDVVALLRPADHDEFCDRVLLGLMHDVSELAENAERVRIQITAIAKDRGLTVA